MRLKLTVAHAERGDEPRTYALEQDAVVIGRAGTCDLPLDDPDRVVSKQHAELRVVGDRLRVVDLGSKNHTFVDGVRVGSDGADVVDGATVELGPFRVHVVIDRDRLIADDLDRTVFGAAFANPFADEAAALADALAAFRRAYAGLDYGHRDDALRTALADTAGRDAEALAAVVTGTSLASGPAAAPPAPATPAASAGDPLDDLFGPPIGGVPAGQAPTPDPFAPPPAATPPAPVPSVGAGPDPLHHALAAVVARLISLPGRFRHEFLGHTVIHAPETAFLFEADPDALLRHLWPEGQRASRLALLDQATEAVLHHHQGLLEGYRAAAHTGAAVLVDGLDPDKLGGDLDAVRQRCAMMRAEDFAAAERRVYRPAFAQAYLDAMARARAAS
ncbi:FHA domain-containing protein [Rubrivirga sp. IMCC43871]|uniref:FHA domain-containing protein n=1 Tax=Rubrivirga sp. IMCC43871 TaxID=3391575 RepID=UPI00398FDE1A